MKILLLGAGALVAGIALGYLSTVWELPDGPSPAVAYLNAAEAQRGGTGAKLGPRIEIVNGELHDFGKMDRNSTRNHTFIIRNSGDAPLKVEKGETTCKCTVSDVKGGNLAPGEETKVVLEWTAKTEGTGFSQSAELITSDPARPKVRLLVKGLVIESVRPDRSELSFNNIPANEKATARMKIFGFREEPLEIESHDWLRPESAEFYSATIRPLADDELDKSIGATSGVELTVQLESGLPLGPLAQTIRLVSNFDVPAVEIPIVGRVGGDITLIGPKFVSDKNILQLGLVEREVGAKVTLRALVKGQHRNDVTLTVASAEPADSLQATVGEPNREQNIVTIPLTIEVPRGAPPVSHFGTAESKAGKIVLKTTHPQVEEIEIEVRFAVNP